VVARSSQPDVASSLLPALTDESAPETGAGEIRVRLERVHGRANFAALRRSRRRSRSGPVGVHYAPSSPADESRRVAYSVPRRVGKATERNRYRRRLREAAREVVPQVPPGAYLIGVEPGVRNVSFQELRKRVTEAMLRASGVGER
jgi:ribonuclease P protein component